MMGLPQVTPIFQISDDLVRGCELNEAQALLRGERFAEIVDQYERDTVNKGDGSWTDAIIDNSEAYDLLHNLIAVLNGNAPHEEARIEARALIFDSIRKQAGQYAEDIIEEE